MLLAVEVDGGKDITILVEAQSNEWRFHIGITQVKLSSLIK